MCRAPRRAPHGAVERQGCTTPTRRGTGDQAGPHGGLAGAGRLRQARGPRPVRRGAGQVLAPHAREALIALAPTDVAPADVRAAVSEAESARPQAGAPPPYCAASACGAVGTIELCNLIWRGVTVGAARRVCDTVAMSAGLPGSSRADRGGSGGACGRGSYTTTCVWPRRRGHHCRPA